MRIPRLVISGLSGGAGKTMLSLGLARAFARTGLNVRAFKKGPDYIDAAWLSLAARAPQANLDPFFSSGRELLNLFHNASLSYDMALVEGNRGLFDGLDLEGTCSTAELARIITAPVLLVVDCTKMTRTVAAVVRGCLDFEENLRIGGVILNRTGNDRHRDMVRKAVEDLCKIPVLGVLPRRAEPFIMERHMGLAGMDEHGRSDALLDSLADFVEEHCESDAIRAIAESAPPLVLPPFPQETVTVPELRSEQAGSRNTRREAGSRGNRGFPPVIAYVRDAAFWFYYRENLDALEAAGATLQPLSLLEDRDWPEIHGLYIGGGLPELHARRLSDNTGVRERVFALAAAGLPIYAECGGLMYLARSLETGGERFAMAGVFDFAVRFHDRPQGLGYIEALVQRENPFHPTGLRFRGHEFHFSSLVADREAPRERPGDSRLFLLTRGRGMGRDASGCCYDGVCRQNVFASYTHIYAPALPHWAPRFVALGRLHRETSPATY